MSGDVSISTLLTLLLITTLLNTEDEDEDEDGVDVMVDNVDCLPTFTSLILRDVEENPLTTERVLIDAAVIANATRSDDDDENPRTMMPIL